MSQQYSVSLDSVKYFVYGVSMTVDDLIAHWGTKKQAAIMLRCNPTALNQWIRRYGGRVPWPYQCAAYFASRHRLKPDHQSPA
jgi:hypothetical protein